MISVWIIVLLVLYCVFYRSLPGGYIICVIITTIRSRFQSRVKHIFDESVISFRVWFCDIDNYGHMNNGSYNLYCDYGRYNLALRLFGPGWLKESYCVVGTANINYIRSLKLFQQINIRTSIVAISGKNVWFRQCFECEGKLYAIATMRMVFLNYQYRTITGKEALGKYITEDSNIVWDGDSCYTPHYDCLAKNYINLHEDVLNSVDAQYTERGIPIQVRSSRPKNE